MFSKCLLNAQRRGGGFPGGEVAEAGRRCFIGHLSDGGITGKSGEEMAHPRAGNNVFMLDQQDEHKLCATCCWRSSNLSAAGTVLH